MRYYIRFDDTLIGDSVTESHRGWFEVKDFNFNVGVSVDTTVQTHTASPPTVSNIEVTLGSNTGIVEFLKSLAKGTLFTGASIEGVLPDGSVAYDIDLKTVLIAGLTAQDTGLTLSLDFAKITNGTGSLDYRGKLIADPDFNWDIVAGNKNSGADQLDEALNSTLATAIAPTKYFMLIDGMNGGSTDPNHLGWFEIGAFNLDAANSGTTHPAGGDGAGRSSFGLLTVDMLTESALTALQKKATAGNSPSGMISGVRIEGVNTSDNVQTASYDLTIGGAFVTNISDTSDLGYQVSFAYKQIEVKTKGNGANSPDIVSGWDNVTKTDVVSIPVLAPGGADLSVTHASKYYLRFSDNSGLNGPSVRSGHEGWFELDSFQFGMSQLVNALTGQSAPPDFSTLDIALTSDTGISEFLKKLASGAILNGASIEGVNQAGDVVFDIDLEKVLIASVSDSAGPGLQLSLDYQKIREQTFLASEAGPPVAGTSFTYDRKTGATAADIAAGATSLDGVPALPNPRPIAASKYFMLIDGMNGGSTDPQHLGWFEIDSFSLQASNGGSIDATGLHSGVSRFGDINVNVSRQSGLTALLQKVASGHSIAGVRIEGVFTDVQNVQTAVYDLTIGNVIVSALSDASDPGYNLNLSYSQIEMKTKGMQDNLAGPDTPVETVSQWNLATNSNVISIPTLSVAGPNLAASSPTTYFLRLDDFKGSSVQDGHVGAFEIAAFSMGVENNANPVNNTGGTPNFSDIQITLKDDSALPKILDALSRGTHLNGATIEGVIHANGQDYIVHDIDLQEVVVSTVTDDSGGGVSLSLNFAKIQEKTGLFDSNTLVTGSPFLYDILQNTDASGAADFAGELSGSGPGIAPDTYYMLIDGVHGGATDKAHGGWFEIGAFNLGASSTVTTHLLNGGGKAQFGQLSVHFDSIDGMTELMQLLTSGHHNNGIKIEGVVNTLSGKQNVVYELNLSDIIVTSVNQGQAAGADRPGFDLFLDYTQIQLKTYGVDPATNVLGLANEYKWNVSENNAEAQIADISPDGTAGDDYLTGTAGNNLINGNAGNDLVYGGAGNDVVLGGSGNDILNGESFVPPAGPIAAGLPRGAQPAMANGVNTSGNDILDGGAGNDTADYDGAPGAVFVTLTDLLNGHTGGYSTGAYGNDTLIDIENINGGDGNDILTGNNLDNYLFGSAGDDVLFGNGGNDNLTGGDGNDSLTGGAGNDSLDGGDGNDVITFDASDGTVLGGAGNDTGIFSGASIAQARAFDMVGHSIEKLLWSNAGNTYTMTLNGDNSRTERVTDTANTESTFASRTTKFDPTGAIDFIDTIGDNGVRIYNDKDNLNNQNYIEYFQQYAGNAIDFVDYRLDDGRRQLEDYDQQNNQSWTRTIQLYDTQGRLDYIDYRLDDGRRQVDDYDQQSNQSWTRAIQLYDTQSRLDYIDYRLDDGRRQLEDYDQQGNQSWSRAIKLYDAQGNLDYTDYSLDDGRRQLDDYDQQNNQIWTRATQLYDTQGRLDYIDYRLDDGRRQLEDYDQLNDQNWTRAIQLYDAQGRLDYIDYRLDDGRRQVDNYDQLNDQSWTRVTQLFDTQGREDYRDYRVDDGSRILIDYDQASQFGWSEWQKTFGPGDVLQQQKITYDNGTTVII